MIMPEYQLTAMFPAEVIGVFQNFYTAELTTIGKNGVPVTWPVMPIFWARRGLFISLSSIGLPQKAFNIRRNPHVSLLFSDSTGSGLDSPPAVLVQGTAAANDRIIVSRSDVDPELFETIVEQARKMILRQPAMALYLKNPLTRYLMDWYFMRLLIVITPQVIQWWPEGDFSKTPARLEVNYVDTNQPLPA